MTGAGSGYIDNGCVLNPFAGITLLYLHDSFPFIEAYSVPHHRIAMNRKPIFLFKHIYNNFNFIL